MKNDVEWVRVAPETWLFAKQDGTCSFGGWPSFPAEFDTVRAVMGRKNQQSTRALLTSAIAAAASGRPSKGRREGAELTLPRYIAGLADDVQRMRPTAPLFRRAADRFLAAQRHELAELANTKAQEEDGHDLLALKDLETLGLPAETVSESLASSTSRALIEFFEDCVEGDQPVRCFGYAFCLEQLALLRGAADLDQVQRLVGPDLNVTRCWRVHSSVGSEPDHVEELVSVISELPPAERASVVEATYQTAKMIFDQDSEEKCNDDQWVLDQLSNITGQSELTVPMTEH